VDLNFGAEHETFRSEVAAFIAEHWQGGGDQRAAAEFRAKAIAQGYLYRAIPRRYGGSEQPADPLKATIIRQAFNRAGAPAEIGGPGPSMLVPTLLERGEEWQREKFVAKTLRGEIFWCQGYSEPGSGSDLASLRTRAVRDGDEWVITGQKVWTSGADRADYMFLLARTDPAAPKHEGLSYFLLDMKQPGVSVRPLRQMNGASGFNEVFLDEARTPADWIVGEPGQGWAVSKSTLKFERDNIGSTATTEQAFRRLVELARSVQRGGRPAIEHEDVRQALATIEGYVLAQKYSSYRQTSMNLRDHHAGLIETMGKLNGTLIGQRIAGLAQELLGSDGLVMPPNSRTEGTARANAKWVNQIMGSMAIAIAGGTSNIQRNVIAERSLGLPREEKKA